VGNNKQILETVRDGGIMIMEEDDE